MTNESEKKPGSTPEERLLQHQAIRVAQEDAANLETKFLAVLANLPIKQQLWNAWADNLKNPEYNTHAVRLHNMHLTTYDQLTNNISENDENIQTYTLAYQALTEIADRNSYFMSEGYAFEQHAGEVMRVFQRVLIADGFITAQDLADRHAEVMRRKSRAEWEDPEYRTRMLESFREARGLIPTEENVSIVSGLINQGKTFTEVATELGFSAPYIAEFCRENSIDFTDLSAPAKARAKWRLVRSAANASQIADLVDQGLTSVEIAEVFNVGVGVIRRFVDEIVRGSYSAHGITVDPETIETNAINARALALKQYREGYEPQPDEILQDEEFIREFSENYAHHTIDEIAEFYGVGSGVVIRLVKLFKSLGHELQKAYLQPGEKPADWDEFMSSYHTTSLDEKKAIRLEYMAKNGVTSKETFRKWYVQWLEENGLMDEYKRKKASRKAKKEASDQRTDYFDTEEWQRDLARIQNGETIARTLAAELRGRKENPETSIKYPGRPRIIQKLKELGILQD